jgi:ribosomal protein L19
MERQQLKLGDKVKMKLVQPVIKCSGREDVTCHYKGEIIAIQGIECQIAIVIRFRYKGNEVEDWYDMNYQQFNNKEYKDIKILWPKVCYFD